MKRILFVSNSQGAASGLADDEINLSYPHLVNEEIKEIDFAFWNRSYLTSVEVNDGFREIVLNHNPDHVILQIGIIECGLRILPKKVRDFLRCVPFGGRITLFLHKHQRGWRKILSMANIKFTDFSLIELNTSLCQIIEKCKKYKIGIALVEIPILSRSCDEEFLFGNNVLIRKFNDELISVALKNGIDVICPFYGHDDGEREELFLKDSVHFTKRGHCIVAQNIVVYINNVLRLY